MTMKLSVVAFVIMLLFKAQAFSSPRVAGRQQGKLAHGLVVERPPSRTPVRDKRGHAFLAVPKEALMWAGMSVAGGLLGTPTVIRATKQVAGWYSTIGKPAWCPPKGAFAPVWTLLYAVIGCVLIRLLVASTKLQTPPLYRASWYSWWLD